MGIHFTWISIISLIAGLIVGALAQRSRMCFIGGWRDFFLIRDSYLLKGFFAFVITAALLFFISFAGGQYLKSYPWFTRMHDEHSAMTEEYKVFYEAGFMELMFMEESKVHDPNSCDLMAFPDMDFYSEAKVPSLQIGKLYIPYQLILILLAGLIIGLFSTLANGCPLRQHVMAASGNLSSICFLLGFYIAIIVFDKYLVQYFDVIMN